MTTQTLDIPSILYHLRHTPQLSGPLKDEVTALASDIRTFFVSGASVESAVDSFMDRIFNLRVEALRWIMKDGDLPGMVNEVIPRMAELKAGANMEVLIENVLFALRCNQRIMESLVAARGGAKITEEFSPPPNITYDTFRAVIDMMPDRIAAQRLLDWMHTSLRIEFVIVAAGIIGEEKPDVPTGIINELAFMVADAAQEHSAIAIEMGVLKAGASYRNVSQSLFDAEFVAEQKNLADRGLDDYAANLSKE